MSENWAKFLQTLAALMVASGVVMYCDMHFSPKPPEKVVVTRVDTLIVRDTLVQYKPVPVNVYVVDTLYYPVPVPGQHDTVWAALPWEEKEYQDSTYRAVVEGFRPSLKEIEVYRQKQVVTVTNTVQLPPPRWSIGVQAGYGASKDGLTPYVGIGIQYRLLDFRK